MEAKQLTTRQWTKKESRLPPKMALVKRVPSPPYKEDSDVERTSETNRMTPEVESRKGGSTVTPKKSAKDSLKESISTSPERGASLPTKKGKKRPFSFDKTYRY